MEKTPAMAFTSDIVSSLSIAEVKEFKEAFDTFAPQNAEKRVTREQVASVMSALTNAPAPAEQLAALTPDMDADGNGTINMPDFLNSLSAQMRDPEEKKQLAEAVQVLDVDGSGAIDAGALRAILTGLGGDKMSNDEVDLLLKQLGKKASIKWDDVAQLLQGSNE